MPAPKRLVGRCEFGHDGQLTRSRKTGKVSCGECKQWYVGSRSGWWHRYVMRAMGALRAFPDVVEERLPAGSGSAATKFLLTHDQSVAVLRMAAAHYGEGANLPFILTPVPEQGPFPSWEDIGARRVPGMLFSTDFRKKGDDDV